MTISLRASLGLKTNRRIIRAPFGTCRSDSEVVILVFGNIHFLALFPRLLQELIGKGLKLFVAGEDELECFSELVESGKCSVPILKCVLNEVLQAHVR